MIPLTDRHKLSDSSGFLESALAIGFTLLAISVHPDRGGIQFVTVENIRVDSIPHNINSVHSGATCSVSCLINGNHVYGRMYRLGR
jgi:hypothetical protein